MGNDRLAETDSNLPELFLLGWRQFRIALGEKVDGLGHPFNLIFFNGTDHATLADGAEKLVTGTVVRRLWLFNFGSVQTSFTRQHYLLEFKVWPIRKGRSFAPARCEESPLFLRVSWP